MNDPESEAFKNVEQDFCEQVMAAIFSGRCDGEAVQTKNS